MTLGAQVRDAQRVMRSWSAAKRATVRLEGPDRRSMAAHYGTPTKASHGR